MFAGARVCFVGFPEDETQHMAEVLASNGGAACALDDPDCTHVVSTPPYLTHNTTCKYLLPTYIPNSINYKGKHIINVHI